MGSPLCRTASGASPTFRGKSIETVRRVAARSRAVGRRGGLHKLGTGGVEREPIIRLGDAEMAREESPAGHVYAKRLRLPKATSFGTNGTNEAPVGVLAIPDGHAA